MTTFIIVLGNHDPKVCLKRVNAAIINSTPTTKIILSGGNNEAHVMKQFIIDKIPMNNIILETKSRTTIENLILSKQLITEKKYNIVICTSTFHIARALILAKFVFENVTGVHTNETIENDLFKKECTSLARSWPFIFNCINTQKYVDGNQIILIVATSETFQKFFDIIKQNDNLMQDKIYFIMEPDTNASTKSINNVQVISKGSFVDNLKYIASIGNNNSRGSEIPILIYSDFVAPCAILMKLFYKGPVKIYSNGLDSISESESRNLLKIAHSHL
jgi:hypothetical protein